MRLTSRYGRAKSQADMTPMIDIVFQLIAFFMFTINLSDAEQAQRATLPASDRAQPPQAPYDHPLTIHLTDRGQFIYAGAVLGSLDELRSALLREKQIIERFALERMQNVTVIIRADQDARSGLVEEII
ncbi:MAG TPA: biopolymer transporter ExbD [Lacipirellulaceae bacterium]|nr:biopolymer transporter ExbD [Lacipirellulaceae bacterium]